MIRISEWRKTHITLGALVAFAGTAWAVYPQIKAPVVAAHISNIEAVIQPEVADLIALKAWAQRTDEEVVQQQQSNDIRNIGDDLRWLRAELYDLKQAQREGDDGRWIRERLAEIEAEIKLLEEDRACIKNGEC